jgi:hypothetical protein
MDRSIPGINELTNKALDAAAMAGLGFYSVPFWPYFEGYTGPIDETRAFNVGPLTIRCQIILSVAEYWERRSKPCLCRCGARSRAVPECRRVGAGAVAWNQIAIHRHRNPSAKKLCCQRPGRHRPAVRSPRPARSSLSFHFLASGFPYLNVFCTQKDLLDDHHHLHRRLRG